MEIWKRRLFTALRYAVYPAFYFTCLFVFFYLTFPWDRLKERLVAEFQATQSMKGAEAQRLEIGSLSGYWITGIEIENAKLIIPPTSEELAAADMAARKSASEQLEAIARGDKSVDDLAAPSDDADGAGDKPSKDDGSDGAKKDGDKKGDKKSTEKVARGPKETVLLIERATARLQLLPLLIGRVQVKFDVEAFGGEIKGSIPVSGKGDVDVAVDHVDLAQIPLVKKALTLPLRGVLSGELTLARQDGKLAKSTGALTVTIEDAVLGDGKSKLMNLVTLPAAKLGKLELAAEADNGLLKITKLATANGDVDLGGEGTIKLKEKWKSSVLDLFVRVKLADEYRNKDDKTKMIFGEPGSKIPGLMDTQPKIKRAKREDDSYGIHLYGSLKAPKFEPWTTDDTTATAGAKKKDKEKDKDPELAEPFKRSKTTPRSPKPRTPGGASALEDHRRVPSDGERAREPMDAPAPPADPLEGTPLQEPEQPPAADEPAQDAPQDDPPAPPGDDAPAP